MAERRLRQTSLDTRLVHAGEPDPPIRGAVVLPIFQSAMYRFGGTAADTDGDGERIRYIRYGNVPNQEAVQAKLADVAGAEDALVAASGMAAISSAVLGNLSAGDRLLAAEGLYGGTHSFFTEGLPEAGIAVDFVDAGDPEAWEPALTAETRAFYVESIGNPLMTVPDLEAVVAFAEAHDLLCMVDNTFATPLNYRPLEHGFDLSLHSGTKYLNGHSDIVAGAVLGARPFVERSRRKLRHLGGALDPHACFLLHRGLKTLSLRVGRQNDSAMQLAAFLDDHPAVARVNYPGLESHPAHRRARELFEGFGGMLSFELQGGVESAEALLEELAVPVVAPSLGGVESLVTRPAATSHSTVPREQREAMGIRDALVRVSVGIEAATDLVQDFGRALEA